MNNVFYIAKRYFLIDRKVNFINIISVLSMLVVTIVTIAMVVVLSVLNGMEDVIRKLYNQFDSEIKITAKEGKAFPITKAFTERLTNIEGVAYVTEVIEDNAIASYKAEKDIVKIKGVSDNFTKQKNVDSILIDGNAKLKANDNYYTIIGAGVQYKLSVLLNDPFSPISIYYPNKNKIRKPDAPDAFNIKSILPCGVFAIEKQYDDLYMFVPIEFAIELMNYGNKRTSLEVSTKKGYSIREVQQQLQNTLGENFNVLNSDEQHAGILKAIRIEKLAVFIILSLLLAVSSVGIYFCLTMLTIRKRKDVAILKSMGASAKTIQNIFLTEGMIIAFSGAGIGLIIGFTLCYIQQTYGIVPLGMETSIVKSYPVKINYIDFVLTVIIVTILTVVASFIPAKKAAAIEVKDNIK